jgi:hypothetical protein
MGRCVAGWTVERVSLCGWMYGWEDGSVDGWLVE